MAKSIFFFPNAWFKIPNLRKFPNQAHKCNHIHINIIYMCTVKLVNLIFMTRNNADFHASQLYVFSF